MTVKNQRKPYLWLAFLLPLLAWFFQLVLSYGLSTFACPASRQWLFHVISAFSLLVGSLGFWFGWKAYLIDKKTMLPQVALTLAGLTVLIILAGDLANFFLKVCL